MATSNLLNNKKKVALQLLFRRILLALVDVIVLVFMGLASYWFVSGSLGGFKNAVFSFFVILQVLVMVASRVYKIRILESSLDLVFRIMGAMIPVSLLFFLYCVFSYGASSIDGRASLVYGCVSLLGVLGVRFVYRLGTQTHTRRLVNGKPKALVYGAGETGSAIVRMSLKNKFDYAVIAFIDDDPSYMGEIVQGIPVLGSIDNLPGILDTEFIDTLIIAINAISSTKMQYAVETARRMNVNVKVVTNLFETKAKAGVVSIRDIDFADLLGRSLISIEKQPIAEMIEEKVVLVTGAGGSIGSEICRQLVCFNPKQLLLLDIDESELHDLCLRLLNYEHEWSEKVMPILCDVRNHDKVRAVFEHFKPDLVFHAAAIKHVPMSELYPEEAVITNVCGSYNVLSSAVASGVSKVVVISTDKAVNPTNVMGSTKRVVEMIASALSCEATEICAVRFGNVIGSRGSMLPLFLEEIKAGVPITVTDKKIIRYFMAIPEAVGLVFRAATLAKGGEVMVLDMGEPVNIYDFAQKLIDIFGDGRSTIKVTGLRPGEKLYEELLANKDTTIPTENKKIFKAKVTSSIKLEGLEDRIRQLYLDPPEVLVSKLHKTVPEWHAQEKSK